LDTATKSSDEKRERNNRAAVALDQGTRRRKTAFLEGAEEASRRVKRLWSGEFHPEGGSR